MKTHTIAPCIQVDHRAYADVDNAQKALVLLLELPLIEYLHREHAVLGYSPAPCISMFPGLTNVETYMSKLSFQ